MRKNPNPIKNIQGQTYGNLSVIRLSENRSDSGSALWICLCSCGKQKEIPGYALRAGYYKSCGCQQEENRNKGASDHIKRDAVAGTRKSALKSKLHKDNTSGVKGVRWNESRQKWTAHIGFRGRQITLGYFKNKQDAIDARREAEKKYHLPILEESNGEN